MGLEKDYIETSKTVAEFSFLYSKVLILHLKNVRAEMEESVKELMQGVNVLTSETSTKAKEAEELLEKEYLQPDENSQALFQAIQNSVDAVLEEALKSNSIVETTDKNNNQPKVFNKLLRRFGTKFSKHMEALSTLDSEIGDIVYEMIAHLSIDDLIRQKLEHVSDAITGLHEGLANILDNFEEKFTAEEVKMMQKDLTNKLYVSYTAEEEKEIFKKYFEVA